jgi:hypothetical protein
VKCKRLEKYTVHDENPIDILSSPFMNPVRSWKKGGNTISGLNYKMSKSILK